MLSEKNDKIELDKTLIRMRKEEFRRKTSKDKNILPKPNSRVSHGRKRKLTGRARSLNSSEDSGLKLKTLDTFWQKAGFSLMRDSCEKS